MPHPRPPRSAKVPSPGPALDPDTWLARVAAMVREGADLPQALEAFAALVLPELADGVVVDLLTPRGSGARRWCASAAPSRRSGRALSSIRSPFPKAASSAPG
ncbi:MAG: hypothetical protein IPK12_15940 [Gemmatimonadetes bacterium]|nr:hypothetical protein [Gemmatimonadota bacterium]